MTRKETALIRKYYPGDIAVMKRYILAGLKFEFIGLRKVSGVHCKVYRTRNRAGDQMTFFVDQD